MDFKLEDLLKNIIPGIVIMTGAYILINGTIPLYKGNFPLNTDWGDFSEIIFTAILIIAYLLGYINDTVASWFEAGPLFWVFHRPAYNLFRDRTLKVKLYDREKIFQELKQQSAGIIATKCNDISRKDSRVIFQKAKDLTNLKAAEVVKAKYDAFYKSYNFARNILVSFIILLVVFWVKKDILVESGVNFLWLNITAGFVILTLLIRWNQRGLYYTRLTLTAAHMYLNNSKENNKTN